VYFPSAKIIHIHRFSSFQTRRASRTMECLSPVKVLHKRRGPSVAWIANLILLFGFMIRMPFWLALDCACICRGNAQKGLIRSRFDVFVAHLKGIFRPGWLGARRVGTPDSVNVGSRRSAHQ